MASRKYLPSDFRLTADFGTYKSVENEFTGINEPRFVKKFTLHYKPHTRTLNQEYLAISAGESESRVIVVRHNKRVTEGLVVVLDGVTYDVTKISPNENFGINKYDFVTLKKTKKVGR